MRSLLSAPLVLLLVALACTERSAPAPEARTAPQAPEQRARQVLERAAPTPEAAEGGRTGPAAEDAGTVERDAGVQGAAPPGDEGGWTAGVVSQRRPDLRPVTLQTVRVGQHAGFDRVVFELAGDTLPGYHVEYIDRPVRRCGSGDETSIAGQGWLQVRLTPAQAHTEAGQATMEEREQRPGLPALLELEQVCDFEGEVTWVLGVRSPNPYRVLALASPSRLVVDVRH